MFVRVGSFGFSACGEASLYRLDNGVLSLELTDYGARVVSLAVSGGRGAPVAAALGCDSAAEYERRGGCLGATCGRCANRIAGGLLPLGGREYRLSRNEGENTLHGGAEGFDRHLWRAEEAGESAAAFSLVSPAGDQGFPGRLSVSVTYSLAGGTLRIAYSAVSDGDTVVNLTNHTYFDLSGAGRGTEARLTVRASRYTPVGASLIPTGELAPVAGTAFDFGVPVDIASALRAEDAQLRLAGGFDHNFALDGAHAATLFCPGTGFGMDVYTSMPGMQLYTANFLPRGIWRGGTAAGPHGAVCLETQFFPDAVHHPAFPQPLLAAGREYSSYTEYRFFTA